jgi:hypothetical protein
LAGKNPIDTTDMTLLFLLDVSQKIRFHGEQHSMLKAAADKMSTQQISKAA